MFQSFLFLIAPFRILKCIHNFSCFQLEIYDLECIVSYAFLMHLRTLQISWRQSESIFMIWNWNSLGIILVLINFSAEIIAKSCWSNSWIHAHTNLQHVGGLTWFLSVYHPSQLSRSPNVFTTTKQSTSWRAYKNGKKWSIMMNHETREKVFCCCNSFPHLCPFLMYRSQSMEICWMSPLRKIVFSSLAFTTIV
jgi:hypothetical protein